MDLEEEKFVWKVSLLGNLGLCFHCKKNGQTKKDFPAINNVLNPKFDSELQPKSRNVQEKQGKDSNTGMGMSVNTKGTKMMSTMNESIVIEQGFDKSCTSIKIADSGKCISLLNTLFEEELEVKMAERSELPSSLINCQSSSLEENGKAKVNLSSLPPPKLNAHQLALNSINEKAENARMHSTAPLVKDMRLTKTLRSIIVNNNDKGGTLIEEPCTEVTNMSKNVKKKRKMDRQSLSNDSKNGGKEMPECFNRLYNNKPHQPK